MAATSGNEEDEAVEQERDVTARPDVEPVEDEDEELEAESEDEEEDRETDEIKEREDDLKSEQS